MKQAIPKYIQIYNELKTDILSNHFFPDSIFPSESELMKRYQVSRTTIRHVISLLNEEHLLEVNHGKRSRVSSANLSNATYTFLKREGNTIISKHFKTAENPQVTSQSIVVDKVLADQETADALALPAGTTVYRLQRVKLVNNEIFSYITSYIPTELTPGLEAYSGQFHYLFSFLAEHYGISPETEKQFLSTGTSGFQESRILNAELGELLLVSKKIVYQSNRPIEYSVTLNRSKLVEVVIECQSPMPDPTE